MIYHDGNQLWHRDSSFTRVPTLASFLSGREVPPAGGETEFASTGVAYDRLGDATRRRIDGLVGVHDFEYSRGLVAPGLLTAEQRAQVPAVRQALVRTNPVNGRKALLVGSHAREIVGMPIDEGRRLRQELLDLATEPVYVLRHAWRRWDLAMWDNRAGLHRGRPSDGTRHRRVMHGTAVAGDRPTVTG
jgi:alpha-ketoglutarate-dependent 2,4-dichlorophenoxyacetate dioxygenase